VVSEPSQKPQPAKKAHELTTEEAMSRLFHPKVVEHAKKHVREAEEKSSKRSSTP
jgi:hypothetical protein